MTKEYKIKKVTTEIFVAICTECGKPFASDVKSKVARKAKDHYRDAHG